MRLISSLLMILGATDIAVAHSLDGSHGLAEQVGHQLIGIHHLPLTILLIAAGYIALKTCYRMLTGRERN